MSTSGTKRSARKILRSLRGVTSVHRSEISSLGLGLTSVPNPSGGWTTPHGNSGEDYPSVLVLNASAGDILADRGSHVSPFSIHKPISPHCRHFSVLTILYLLFSAPCVTAADEKPDAVALLRGVQASREALKSGRIEMSIQWHVCALRDTWESSVTYEFDGEKRTLRQGKTILALKKGRTMAQLEAMNYDKDAFVRAGHGEFKQLDLRAAWNGSDYCQYGKEFGVSFRDRLRTADVHMFDPRLIGILHGYNLDQSLDDCLGYKYAKSATVIGSEQINGRQTWQVVLRPFEDEHQVWVEDVDPFRVHRFIYKAPARSEQVVVESEFDQYRPVHILPSRVRRTDRIAGKTAHEVTLKVTRLDLHAKISDKVGTLASLDLPIGEAVVDERHGRRLGYWDGEGIVEDRAVAKAVGKQREESANRSRLFWRLGVGGFVAAACAAVVIVVRKRLAIANRR